jgi:hypothetical protein
MRWRRSTIRTLGSAEIRHRRATFLSVWLEQDFGRAWSEATPTAKLWPVQLSPGTLGDKAMKKPIAGLDSLLAEVMARRAGQPKPPKPRKRRLDEGGEPMPAVPRPKPKPLSGGAAAPIEVKVRLAGAPSQLQRIEDRPPKEPSEADRSPSLDGSPDHRPHA